MDANYINQQLVNAVPLTPENPEVGQIRIKITSDLGQTNWLNITPQQLRAIERVLDGSAEHNPVKHDITFEGQP